MIWFLNIIGFIGKHYQLFLILAIAGVIAFFAWDYQHTKAEIAVTKTQLATAESTITVLQNTMATYQKNMTRLNGVLNKQSRLIQKQASVKDKMNSVPVTKEDHPFADDPGLLDRARIMRDYQSGSSGSNQASGSDPAH